MPEIWMPYGDVEVVINVKAEQLTEVINVDYYVMDKDSLRSKLAAVHIPDIIVHDQFEYSKNIAQELISIWGEPGKTIKVLSNYDIMKASSDVYDKETGPIDGSMIRLGGLLTKLNALVIAMGSFHPVYGYYGAIPLIAEMLGLKEEMLKRWRKNIESGKDADPLWFAEKVVSNLKNITTLEYVLSPSGIAYLAYGDMLGVKASVKEFLDSKRQVKARGSRLVIFGCGGFGLDYTLSSALVAVSNNISIVPKDAEIIIVAECGKGLGSQELRSAVDNAILDKSSPEGFILEYLKSIGNLHLVSALPKSIVEKRLGIIAHSSLREAFESIESKHGWKLKSTILPHASLIMTTKLS